MARKRKGKAVKKARAGAADITEEDLKKYPHSMVFHRGTVGKNMGDLVKDMRRVMEPFTATSLKVRKNNVLKDFVNIAGPLNVSHFLTFTKTKLSNNLRIMRLPRGPTLTFKIKHYSLCRDVISTLKRYAMDQKLFQHHPLLVMNSFSGDGMHIKLITTMFQHLFPSINVNKIKLSNIRRIVLLNFDPQDNSVEFRHYCIKAVPVGMSKGVKKIVKAEIPNMARYKDISEYLLRGGDMSESEAELDGDHNEVVLPQSMSSRGNIKAAKSAIRLTEIGPRLSLQLVKIEEGVCDGEVLYHQYIEKTDEQKKLLEMKRKKKKKLRDTRKRQQEENVRKKTQTKERNKEKCLAGMKKEEDAGFEEVENPGTPAVIKRGKVTEASSDSEDDKAYYRAEVGEEPEPELFPKSKNFKGQKRKRQNDRPNRPYKRTKTNAATNKTNSQDMKKQKNKAPLTEIDKIKRRKVRKQQKINKGAKRKGFNKSRPAKK